MNLTNSQNITPKQSNPWLKIILGVVSAIVLWKVGNTIIQLLLAAFLYPMFGGGEGSSLAVIVIYTIPLIGNILLSVLIFFNIRKKYYHFALAFIIISAIMLVLELLKVYSAVFAIQMFQHIENQRNSSVGY